MIQVLNIAVLFKSADISLDAKKAIYIYYRFFEIDVSFHLMMLIFFSMVCSGIELYFTFKEMFSADDTFGEAAY